MVAARLSSGSDDPRWQPTLLLLDDHEHQLLLCVVSPPSTAVKLHATALSFEFVGSSCVSCIPGDCGFGMPRRFGLRYTRHPALRACATMRATHSHGGANSGS